MGKKTARKLEIAKAESTELLAANLVDDLRNLISQTRSSVAQTVNTALVTLYWQIGTRIRSEVLKNERAEYGKQIIATVSQQLENEFGHGFSQPNLSRMTQLAEHFPDFEIYSTLSNKLSWSHFVELIRVKDDLKREFYAEMCGVENWSAHTYLENPVCCRVPTCQYNWTNAVLTIGSAWQ